MDGHVQFMRASGHGRANGQVCVGHGGKGNRKRVGFQADAPRPTPIANWCSIRMPYFPAFWHAHQPVPAHTHCPCSYRTSAPFTVPSPPAPPVLQHFTDQGGQIVQRALAPFLQHLVV